MVSFACVMEIVRIFIVTTLITGWRIVDKEAFHFSDNY